MASTFEILKGTTSQTADEITLYADICYDSLQMEQIRLGIDSGINVAIYTDPTFSHSQMKQIRLGILEGVDAERYANTSISADSMEIIRLAMNTLPHDDEFDEKIDAMFKYNYNDSQILEIYYGLIECLDVSKYENPQYTSDQMRIIRESLLENWDVSPIQNPDYSPLIMSEIKSCMQIGFNIKNAVDCIIQSRSVIEDAGISLDMTIRYVIEKVIYTAIVEDIDYVDGIETLKSRMTKHFKMCGMFSFKGKTGLLDSIEKMARQEVIRLTDISQVRL